MKARLKRLQRIGKLQGRLHDLAVWRLFALGQQRDQLKDAHLRMLEATSAGLFAFGDAAAAANRRIRAIEIEIEIANRAYEAQSHRSREQGARSQLAEGALRAAKALSRRDQQSKELVDLIDSMLRASNPASRKA